MTEAEIEYERSFDYFTAVAAVLRAGDVQARVVDNTVDYSVEVRLIDGSRYYWTNAGPLWALSHLGTDGTLTSEPETLPWNIDVEDAAKMIAMHDYPAPAEFPHDE